MLRAHASDCAALQSDLRAGATFRTAQEQRMQVNIEIVRLILEFMAKLAWPLVVVSVLFMFRNQIKQLVDMLASLSTMRMKLGGQEFTLERRAREKLIVDQIESTLSNEQRINKDNIHDIARKIASDILSLENMTLAEADILALKIIHERKEMSSLEVETEAKKRGVFVNLGTLTGLEHDELISGHLLFNPMTNRVNITEKGRKLLELLTDEETYRKYVYNEK
jgi:hypothetical protein